MPRFATVSAAVGGAISLVLLCTVALIWAWPSASRPKILLLVDGAVRESRALAAGAAAAAEGADVDLHVEAVDPHAASGATPRGRALLTCIERGQFHGVILGPMPPLSAEEEEELAGLSPSVHVVACQPDMLSAVRRLQVGASDYALGRMAAALVRSMRPPAGAVSVALDGRQGRHLNRLSGFEDALSGPLASGNDPPCTLVARVAVANHPASESTITQTVGDMLTAHPDVGCVVCFGPAQTEAAAQYVAGQEVKRVSIVAFEPTASTYRHLVAGRIDAIVADDPYAVGYNAVRCTIALFAANEDQLPASGHGVHFVRPQIITRENLRTSPFEGKG